jgi:hypothetical protein
MFPLEHKRRLRGGSYSGCRVFGTKLFNNLRLGFHGFGDVRNTDQRNCLAGRVLHRFVRRSFSLS